MQPASADIFQSTLLGGSGDDEGWAIAVDDSGAAYIAGGTHATAFPTTPGAFDTTWGDTFVAKLNPTATGLIYSTFLGGGGDWPIRGRHYGIAIDSSGAAYITGSTWSAEFPATSGAYDPTWNGMTDVFVTKLNPAGSALEYSTFLGSEYTEWSFGIAVDAAGAAYVTGRTYDNPNFPVTPGAFDLNIIDGYNAFVVKLNPAGTALEYSTLLGGSNDDFGRAIAVDSSGCAFVTGNTNWVCEFPTTPGAYDTTFNGYYVIFVTKLNASGSALEYSTFLGQDWYNEARAIAVDSSGAAYITGETSSHNNTFPVTPGAFDTTRNGTTWNSDAFVTKFNPAGSALVYSTYLGGAGDDFGLGIRITSTGAVYVTGETASTDFPTTPGAYGTSYLGGAWDAFVVKLSTTGSAMQYGSYLGGIGEDHGNAIAVGPSNLAYVTGSTWSANFPTTPGAFDTSHNGESDVFITTVMEDTTLPTVLSITRQNSNPSTASNLNFLVTFSEAVTGVEADDFTLATTGSLSGVSVANVSGTGVTRTVTVATGTGKGALRLDIPTTATITDIALNPLTDLPYSLGESYSLRVSFTDVLATYWAWSWIERLYNSGITTGCNTGLYCPEEPVTRAQMAVFLIRATHGVSFVPPAPTGIFTDVPTTAWAANYIEQLYADGITTGCNPALMLYCPAHSVTRAQMAAFLLRAKHGAGYAPPDATGIFSDVPTTYWAAAWIESSTPRASPPAA